MILMVSNSSELLKVFYLKVSNGTKKSKMVPKGTKRLEMVLKGSKWYQKVLNDYKRFQMAPKG